MSSTQLARFKVPREFVFVDDLPRTALGKVQHFMLKQLDPPGIRARRSVLKIAVLGGGNGSFAAAGDFTLAAMRCACGGATRLESRNITRRAPVYGQKRQRAGTIPRLALVTADLAAAVNDAELILCPAPASRSRHRRPARAASARGQVVFLLPGSFGSMIFARAAREAGDRATASASPRPAPSHG